MQHSFVAISGLHGVAYSISEKAKRSTLKLAAAQHVCCMQPPVLAATSALAGGQCCCSSFASLSKESLAVSFTVHRSPLSVEFLVFASFNVG